MRCAESYAGVLVPTVSLQILKHKTDANKETAPWNLKGFALGNDCPGNQIYTCTPYSGWRGTKVALDFRFGHGMISEKLYAKITAACKDWWLGEEPFPSTNGPSKEGPPEGSECRNLLEDPVRPCLSEAGDTCTFPTCFSVHCLQNRRCSTTLLFLADFCLTKCTAISLRLDGRRLLLVRHVSTFQRPTGWQIFDERMLYVSDLTLWLTATLGTDFLPTVLSIADAQLIFLPLVTRAR